MRVAIFDFDGTLYEKETFPLLMEELKNHPIYHIKYKHFFRSMLPRYIGYKLKVYPEHKMRERSMQLYINALKSLTTEEITTYFKQIGEKMPEDFNPQVLAKLEQHLNDNIHVILVSGAYTQLIKSATSGLHFDEVFGTNIPMHNQQLDINKKIHHIQGTRKIEVIQTALKDKNVDWSNSFAYADSYSDLPVLELVGNPVAVQPDARLQSVANKYKWEVIY